MANYVCMYVWGCISNKDITTIQNFQNKLTVNAPWYVRNKDLEEKIISIVKLES